MVQIQLHKKARSFLLASFFLNCKCFFLVLRTAYIAINSSSYYYINKTNIK